MRTLLLLAGLASSLAAATVDVAPSLRLTLPDGWTAVAGERTTLIPPQRTPHIQVWQLTTGSDVAAALPGVAAAITAEVKEFKPGEPQRLTVAGAPAVVLSGPGVEADDGDPANADATVFTVAGAVYVVLAHGEGDGVAKRRAEVAAIVATAAAAAH